MEGVLWTRDGRGKLLRGWHKRYVVLSERGQLREYGAEPARSRRASSGASTASSHSSPGAANGMALRRELDVRGAQVKTLAFPLIGRHHAFQVATPTPAAAKIVLSARGAEDAKLWVAALRSAALQLAIPSPIGCAHEEPMDDENESRFLEVNMPQRAEMARLSSVYEWLHEGCVKTTQNVTVAGVHVPRGSLLVSANGVSLQTLTSVEVRKLLLESAGPLPVSLRFLRSPAKCGVLRAKLYTSPLTQFKSLARYRKASRKDWKEQVVDLSGDLLTCQLKVKTPMAIGTSKSNRNSTGTKTKRVLVLTSGSSVKPVHELVSDRKFCFMVTVQTHSMLFQARSEADRRAWTDCIQRAITIAEGLVPGGALARGSFDLDALQHQSSRNMRHLDQAFEGMEEGEEALDFDDENNGSDDDFEEELSPGDVSPPLPSAEDWISATQSAAYLPDDELTEMLRILQSSGRFIEALQLMQKNTTLRAKYWRQIFRWALIPARSDEENKDTFQQLICAPLSEEWVFSSCASFPLDTASA
ncbi:unnamed protein product [Phytophthora lilii]|uniref:Unnamed protein product n=1 Tax=Phytophthora lilii TaxID=2077276 RepID=A0A9W6TZG2_9STRA|nr:unnamed protein product [Phytophthora lilii]